MGTKSPLASLTIASIITFRIRCQEKIGDLVYPQIQTKGGIFLWLRQGSDTTISYHEHNEIERTAELTARLLAGAAIALVSDARLLSGPSCPRRAEQPVNWRPGLYSATDAEDLRRGGTTWTTT